MAALAVVFSRLSNVDFHRKQGGQEVMNLDGSVTGVNKYDY